MVIMLVNKKLITYTMVTLSLALLILSAVAQNSQAREEITVQVSYYPNQTSVFINNTVQFTATASGGPGAYNYQWYVNDTAISGATTSTYNFTATVIGNWYGIKCVVNDATGLLTEPTTSATILLSVTARAVVAAVAPQATNLTNTEANTEDQGLPVVPIVAAVVVIAVAVVFSVIIMRQRTSKKSSTP